MRFPHQKLIHWLCAITFLWSVFTPALAQAFEPSVDGSFLTMELCALDGSKQTINLDTEAPVAMSNDCPYCVTQSLAPLSLLTNLEFASPSTPILTANLYLESAKTLFAWVKLPAQGPPSNACI
ncbi:DUF2946 family protein [Polynucleobacter acidiphobus]|uniref:DUF2946 family protein n=1 Tax=Polynucleobacter acidiphobus TaxID=556053 RepID=UPI000D338315|nr:DUF2946 family protein [Polynucleobacter acidiphobus]